MHRYKSFIITFPLIIFACFESKGQVVIPASFEDLDKFTDSTTLGFYESIKISDSSWEILDPLLKVSFNSTYPRGYNDGAVWKGKGMNFELHGGIAGQKGRFSYTVHPVLYYSQNTGVSQLASDEFKYPFAQIDWVQRYGNDGFISFHPGQTEVKMQWGKFSTSISTQNYSAGPSVYNPITLSRQGGGFPHVKLALDPFDINIRKVKTGKWEVNLIAGVLSESDYFDTNSQNDNRYINGLFLAYQPSFLPELTLGFNKVLYKDTQFFNAKDLLSTIHILDDGVRGDSIDTNDTFDQLASATMNWDFPEVGFRAYGEFSRNDFSGKFVRFLREPEHSRAYTVGLEKRLINAKGSLIIINAEHTNLSRNHTFLYQPEPSYYIHNINKQGYTNSGQLLGAGIGPGSNSDQLRVRVEKERKITEIYKELNPTKTISWLTFRIELNTT